MRQLLALLFAALLSPAVQLLPRSSATLAGEAGWLSALAALPVYLLLCWLVLRLLGRFPEGTGLAEAFQHTLGAPLGKGLTLLYLLWGLVALAANLRSCGQRLLTTSYRNTSLWGFVFLLLAVVLWTARGKLSAFARAGEIFFLILCMALGAVLFFGAFNLEADNVLPVWVEDVPDVLTSAVPVLGTLGHTIFGGFLAGELRRKEGDRRRALGWAAVFCLLLTAFQLVNLGNFGPGLVSRMDVPLYMLAKGIGVRGGFERIESVVVALWVLSDLVLAGVLALACCRMARSVFGLRRAEQAVLPVALLGGAGAVLLFSDGFALRRFTETILTAGNLLLGFAVPLVVCLVAAVRQKSG